MELNIIIPPAIAFVVFLTLGITAWSYRDVANRHSDRVGHDDHAGH
jgi:hypothetical protein